MDGLDLNNIGFKYVDIPDPTSGEGGGGTATGAVFFDKTTGKEIPDYLGNNRFLVVDRATQKPKIQQGWQNEGLAGIYHGFKEIATNPGVQYIAKAALLGNAAAGLGAGAGAGAGGYGVGAETAMNDLLMQEAASGGLGSLATVPTAESAMADVLAQEAAAGAGTTSAEAAMADLMSTEGAAGAEAASGLPEATYSNEGRNYPTPESTQGAGGSPVNASTATAAGLPGLKVSDSGLSLKDLSTAAKLAMLGAGGAGIKSLTDQKSGTITSGDSGATGPLAGYTFDPSAFRSSTPDPMWFRPGSEIETVSSQAKRGYAEGGSTKPTLTPKAKLAAMDPWTRALAEMNNAAYGARMPRAMTMPQAGIAQLGQFAQGGQTGYNLGGYSDGGRLLRGPGDGVSDSIPATIGQGQQPARLADGEFVIPARIVSELGNGSTEAGARKLYAMMDRVQRARGKTTGKGKVAADTNADKHLPA